MDLISLAVGIGLTPKFVAHTQGAEYHSPCPRCGGSDRFYMQPYRAQKNCTGYYCCRQCGINGDTIQFYMDFYGATFPDACARLGITLPQSAPSRTITGVQKMTPPTYMPPQSAVGTLPQEWIEKANGFVEWAHKHLLNKPEHIARLVKRGISEEAIARYKIGWCPEDVVRSRMSWGMSLILHDDGSEKALWIPRGIVVPTTADNGDVIRIKIRRAEWHEHDTLPKYLAVSGSRSGLNIIGDPERLMMVVVESELDAYAVDCAVGDFACAVAVGSNTKEPDIVTDFYAQHVPVLLICHDNDDAGRVMLEKWQQRYAHAQAMPTPQFKDIGEAIENGFDIRAWLSSFTKTVTR